MTMISKNITDLHHIVKITALVKDFAHVQLMSYIDGKYYQIVILR